MRVPLEDLGPALFNRHGAATCGKHCHELAKRILTMEGFATFRYVAGFCHEPDPMNPLSVSNHGNSMAEMDELLPRLPMKPLKGVFAKTHLVTFLQLLKGGRLSDLQRSVPELAAAMKQGVTSQGGSAPTAATSQGAGVDTPASVSDLMDVLENGICMHVFPWWVIRDHAAEVTALMAADNFDHGHGLADSEMRCIQSVRAALTAISQGRLSLQGRSEWDVVSRQVLQLSGQRWQPQDIGHFWDFVKSTLPLHLDLLHEVWTTAGCESELSIEAAWFGNLAKSPSRLPWTRTGLAVAHFLSDKEKECSWAAGKCIANAVPKTIWKKLRERQAAISQEWEEWMAAIAGRYALDRPTDAATAQVPRTKAVLAFAAFLCRAGRAVMGAGLESDMAGQQGKLEEKLRTQLAKHWCGTLPDPISTAKSHDATTPGMADSVDQAPSVDVDESGNVVVSARREARARGLLVGASVLVRLPATAKRQGEDPLPATITDIMDTGVVVKLDDPAAAKKQKGVITVDVDDVQPMQKKQKTATSHDVKTATSHGANDGMEMIKWAPCSTEDNAAMLKHVLIATLYQTYVGRSSLHSDLCIGFHETGGWQIRAARDMAPGALMILPWGNVVDQKAKPPLPVILEIGNGDGTPQVGTFWLEAKVSPKKVTRSAERAVAVVPFWILANAATATKASVATAAKDHEPAATSQATATSQGKGVALVYKPITLPVPQPQGVGPKKAKNAVMVKTVCITNDCVVPKGAALYVSTPPTQNAIDECTAATSHDEK